MRFSVAIGVATALLAAAGWLLVPAGAQSQASPPARIPCRVSFEDTTHGGDSFTVRGEAKFTQVAPQADGSFVAIGSGEATVTFHPATCRLTSADNFTAPYMVIMQSDDGKTAQIDFSSVGEQHTFKLVCGLVQGRGASKLAETSADYDAPEIPSVTVALREGETPFGNDQAVRTPAGVQHVGDTGKVTLHYCAPGESNAR
ncbi:MAG TPA: hypothetical protein VL131_11890 [Gammaproteobacteria bacterium]|nr:hypothetical protein [Gammaproteobacteria bacterium]